MANNTGYKTGTILLSGHASGASSGHQDATFSINVKIPDYEEQYFTIVADYSSVDGSTSATINLNKSSDSSYSYRYRQYIYPKAGFDPQDERELEYNGVWSAIIHGSTDIDVPGHCKISIQIIGYGNATIAFSESEVIFDGNAPFKVCGNLNSLFNSPIQSINDESYIISTFKNSFGNDQGSLARVFSSEYLTDAYNLVIPYTTINEEGRFEAMFSGSTNLKRAPKELPATRLSERCYAGMFYDCTSLITVPSVLPATEVPSEAYMGMFALCSSILKGPNISATNFPVHSVGNCQEMFLNCTSMQTGTTELKPEWYTTSCYKSMFEGCTKLYQAPKIYAKSSYTLNITKGSPEYMEYDCCKRMFYGCSSMRRSSEGDLYIGMVSPYSASCNAYGFFESMFEGCTNLIKPPRLRLDYKNGVNGKALSSHMFYGCSKIQNLYLGIFDTSNKYFGTSLNGWDSEYINQAFDTVSTSESAKVYSDYSSLCSNGDEIFDYTPLSAFTRFRYTSLGEYVKCSRSVNESESHGNDLDDDEGGNNGGDTPTFTGITHDDGDDSRPESGSYTGGTGSFDDEIGGGFTPVVGPTGQTEP